MSVATLTTNTVPLEDLTGLDAPSLITEAKYILELIEPNWKAGKKYKYTTDANLPISVPTFSNSRLNDDTWYARVYDFTEFGDPLKERYHQALLQYIIGSLTDFKRSHTEYEKHYVKELYDYELTPFQLAGADPQSFTYLAQCYYKFPFPLKKRVFYELVHIYKPSDNEAYVISLAVHPKNFERPGMDSDFTQGRYTSIEKVTYEPESKELKWTMATCSQPGGKVPHWFTHANLGSAISKDVPHFINWVDTLKTNEALQIRSSERHEPVATTTSSPIASPATQTQPVAGSAPVPAGSV
ncbi:uncharacterized protein CANTADRAFT_48499 [Suhomyces tanzawaensis NRRL Y-17324]|uniref:DUF3074 domain-containing protein n=1 Tax=Suhomyces tanzawaensis NRRL Y-17324 TaxID=984487 RepID=A0A1E4SLE3_9ASCO|nr:uncharacterized protein CANTADRAFT_48499 [Suhomyces tanzawaensis NRRL Y-17324]ODV80326.1 hypothetical protein CANTADRAFT_48499 [Suhomyces tanzawaensis NRRL Y-17324]